ncbi:MAG: hypothetical protein CBC73_04235 [Flavobacteriales bacterium TMED113]|nr:MAG: hypothetical protein CBC73_04235 [Flavobacteriales bacterium TMED113]
MTLQETIISIVYCISSFFPIFVLIYNKIMKKTFLSDKTPIYCIIPTEALILDEHIKGYLDHGIFVKENDTIIDVGANIGVLGIRLSKSFKSIYIHSFEPIPEIFNVLKKNSQISKNKNFKVYQKGIGHKSSKQKFTYFPNSPALSTAKPEMWKKNPKAFIKAVKGSIKNAPKKFWWAKLIPSFLIPFIAKRLLKNSRKIVCEISTISKIIKEQNINEINLLKIDCEGFEWNVLMGIQQSDWRKIHSIVMEIHDVENRLNNTVKLLKKHGFKNIKTEKEKALKETKLINLYATK